MKKKAMIGHKVRRFRKDQDLSQADMAAEIGISASYLNLIENNQRPVTVPLLFKLGQAFDIDLRDFAEDEDARLAAGLAEVFADPMFGADPVGQQDIRDLASASPAGAEAVMHLYRAYRALHDDTQALAHQLSDREPQSAGEAFPVEQVRDVLEAESNHFPDLEIAAERLWVDQGFAAGALYHDLSEHLKDAHGIGVRVMPFDVMGDVLRRFQHHQRRLMLSEALPPSGRIFQLGVQLALFDHQELIERLVTQAGLATEAARGMLRMSLANYFAGAVMMPYERFLEAARGLRYDIDLLARRFDASFEQVCHRLTTLQRSGARGVPFFFIRVDTAGNVSKRLSGGGFQFARFAGTCPRWVVHDGFRTPGVIRVQIAEMPDRTRFLTVARTVEPIARHHRAQHPQFAVALGCEIRDAKHLVYADHVELAAPEAATPIGVSCRVCERHDCAQRAHPPLNHRLRIDEHLRRTTPYGFAS